MTLLVLELRDIFWLYQITSTAAALGADFPSVRADTDSSLALTGLDYPDLRAATKPFTSTTSCSSAEI
jgi:hypothetical protein